MTRRLRRMLTAVLAMACLLLSQMAVAAYFCAETSPTAAIAAAQMPSDCEQQADPANLCQQHCQFGYSAVDAAKPVPTLDVTAASPLLLMQVPAVPSSQAPRLHRRVLPPEPPPAIRFSVLRI